MEFAFNRFGALFLLFCANTNKYINALGALEIFFYNIINLCLLTRIPSATATADVYVRVYRRFIRSYYVFSGIPTGIHNVVWPTKNDCL